MLWNASRREREGQWRNTGIEPLGTPPFLRGHLLGGGRKGR